MTTSRRLACAAAVAAMFSATVFGQRAASRLPPPAFRIEEATIAGVHAAMKAHQLTCRTLVERYLRRIEAYDKAGPAINSIAGSRARV
jgi:hypothetical protein